MIARIWDYFGIVGVASIAAWLLAIAALVLYAVKLRQPRVIYLALALSFVGIVLAEINSTRVDAIQVLPETTPPPDQQEQVSERTLRTIKTRASEIRFAEDDKAASTATKPASDDLAYDYRKGGKQTRESGKSLGHGVTVPTAATSQPAEGDATTQPAGGVAAQAAASDVRRMSSIDVTLANRYDGMNIRLSRFALLAVVLFLAIDYARRFGNTIDRLTPLPAPPIIENAVSRLLIPARRVLIARAALSRDSLRSLLHTAVRKGEVFVYLGGGDPLTQPTLATLPVARGCARLDTLTVDGSTASYDARFAADAAWFRKAAVVATGDTTFSVLNALVTRALHRETIEPHARRRLNIVWDRSDLPPEQAIADLVGEAHAKNLRFIVIADDVQAAQTAMRFDDVITEIPDGLWKPTVCERVLTACDAWATGRGKKLAQPLTAIASKTIRRIDASVSGPDRAEIPAARDTSTT